MTLLDDWPGGFCLSGLFSFSGSCVNEMTISAELREWSFVYCCARYCLIPSMWRLMMACEPVSDSRKARSSGLSIKRFSVRTAGQLVWRMM